jgi:hypothetical protein
MAAMMTLARSDLAIRLIVLCATMIVSCQRVRQDPWVFASAIWMMQEVRGDYAQVCCPPVSSCVRYPNLRRVWNSAGTTEVWAWKSSLPPGKRSIHRQDEREFRKRRNTINRLED